MQQSIVPVSNAVVQELVYADVRNNLSGKGKNVPVNYRAAGGEPVRLVVQTPRTTAPFGLDRLDAEEGGAPKYSMTLSFKGREYVPQMQSFFDLLHAIDERNVTEAVANQSTWWPGSETKTRDIIEDRYHRIVTQPENTSYDANVRVKIPTRNGQFETLAFDDSATPQPIGVDEIGAMCQVICLVELGPLWIADKKFGQTIKCIRVKVFKTRTISLYSISDSVVALDDAWMEESEAVIR